MYHETATRLSERLRTHGPGLEHTFLITGTGCEWIEINTGDHGALP